VTDMTMAKALNAGLRRAMERDPKVLLFGEDIGQLGGVFRITDELQKDFGEHRVLDAPLAESAIVGTAIGMALRGFRPVLEMQFDGFVYPAFDQIVSQVAKLHARSVGAVRLPIVIRIPYGGGIGAVEHHSESPESYFVHTAGLRVLTPGDPQAAYWTIQQAIECEDPVIFFEPKRRYWDRGEVQESMEHAPDPWHARVLRSGEDLTLACYGPMVRTCVDLAAQDDVPDMTVVDLQSLSPLDLDAVYADVERTGRLVVVHEAARTLGVGAEVAARVQERCFFSLEAPVHRVTGYDIPYPPSRLEEHYLPNADRILDAVDRVMEY
jgi:2-oxoisovalerate dehydrogenase E1 component beta subunit